MEKHVIEIPTELLRAAKLTADDAKVELAIRLYQSHKLSLEQARQLAGDSVALETLVWNERETGKFDINEFIAWASHDLKSPLNAIIGFTRVVMKGIDGPVNESQTADLNAAFKAGQRMLLLVGNLVEMARLNVGQVTVHPTDCDLAALMNDIAHRWQMQNPTRTLTADIQLTNPTFHADGIHLRHAIAYLLNYASVRVTSGTLVFSARDDENGMQGSIQSTGEKSHEKFEMDSAMFNFVCASLIKLHGGNMEIPQDADNGLLVRFTLPR